MGGMMGGGLAGIFGLLMLIITIALIVGIVLLVIWLVRQFSPDGGTQGLFRQQDKTTQAEATPREILKKRYARGEISREEYQQMLSDLN